MTVNLIPSNIQKPWNFCVESRKLGKFIKYSGFSLSDKSVAYPILRLFFFPHLICSFFCSYDLRGRGPEKARHWSDDHVLGKSRAMFFMAPKKSEESLLSVLKIRAIQDGDRGIYRCRVDFKAAPTRNTRANLTVIGK